jgi:HemY protein
MIKLVSVVVLLALAALGFAWLADRPGALALDWMGYRVETTVFVAVVALIGLVLLAILVSQILRYVLHGPEAFTLFWRARRREKGIAAIGRGLVAVGAGDSRTALRAALDAENALGQDPMALLLRSQAAQLAGDRDMARKAFERMMATPDTRALGLRGLYVEATRAHEPAVARRHAEQAVAERLAAPWATTALLAFQAGAKEWDGALETIRRATDDRLIDRDKGKRLRAVVLTAKAIETEATDRAGAKTLALEAHGLAPDLVPAAEVAARLATEAGDVRRATKVIETTWKLSPHPDLSAAYTHARLGDAARDRLKRARALADLAPRHPEGVLAIAGAAMEARDFEEARRVLAPLLEAPSRRVCLVMAQLAEAEDKIGEAREWLARATSAAADPVWIADGYVSDRWLPLSPVDARLDAFEWKSPMEVAPGRSIPGVVLPVIPAAPVVAGPRLAAPEPEPVPAPVPAAVVEVKPEPAPVVAAAPESAAPAPAPEAPAPVPAAEPERPKPRLVHPIVPDDPGVDPKPAPTPEPKKRKGFLGIF